MVVDVNGDGFADVSAVDTTNSKIVVMLGNGDGTLKNAVSYAVSGADGYRPELSYADINGDGAMDLVAPGGPSNLINWLTNNGDGTFKAATSITRPYSSNTRVADFNGDGKVDIFASHNAGDASLRLGNGDGTFLAERSFSFLGDAAQTAVGDFNGDGNVDVAAVYNSQTFIYAGNGDGTIQAGVTLDEFNVSGEYLTDVRIADYNGDGEGDVITLSNRSNARVLPLKWRWNVQGGCLAE